MTAARSQEVGALRHKMEPMRMPSQPTPSDSRSSTKVRDVEAELTTKIHPLDTDKAASNPSGTSEPELTTVLDALTDKIQELL